MKMKWLSIEEWVVDRTWVRIYMILKKNGEKWEGAYFGWKLSAETFAYENGISVQEMPETAEHRIDEYGFHQRELRKEREGRGKREMEFLVVGLLGSNSKIGAARVSRHFKNTMSRDMDSMEVEAWAYPLEIPWVENFKEWYYEHKKI